MCAISWLPPLVFARDYEDFDAYIDALYGYYAADFITDHPSILNKAVLSKRVNPYRQMDHSFWHCIERAIPGQEVCEENREVVYPLCERIRWPRPIIEQAIKSSEVLAWTEVRRGHGTKERVHLFVPAEGYVVVLDPRGKAEDGGPKYYYLWTTFLCKKRQIASLKKRYEHNEKLV